MFAASVDLLKEKESVRSECKYDYAFQRIVQMIMDFQKRRFT